MSKHVIETPSAKRNRTANTITWAFLGLLVLLVFGYRLYNRSGIRRLSSKINQRGEPSMLADLAEKYSIVSDGENGATALLDIWEKDSPEFWKAFRSGASVLPERTEPRIDEPVPFRSMQAPIVRRNWRPALTNLIAAEHFLRDQRTHMEAVRHALRSSTFCFPVQISNTFRPLVPHLTELKKEALNFRVEGLLAVERADVDGALDALEDTARVGDAVRREPIQYSQLMRVAAYRMVLIDSERLLSSCSLSDSQLKRLNALLDRVDPCDALHQALISERALEFSIYDLPVEAFKSMKDSEENSEILSPAASQSLVMGVLNVTGVKDADRKLMLETLTEAIALSERFDPEAIQKLEQMFREAGADARRFPPKPFSAILLPWLEALPLKFVPIESRRRAAVVAVAVERYRLANVGRLPDDLQAMVPQFLSEIPLDPYDGKPIRFRPREIGFVTYSVGIDRVDNDGAERLSTMLVDTNTQSDETFTVAR
jgi:hypothetical protein